MADPAPTLSEAVELLRKYLHMSYFDLPDIDAEAAAFLARYDSTPSLQREAVPGGRTADPLAETPANIEFVAGFFDRYTPPSEWPDSCGPAVALLRALRERAGNEIASERIGVKLGRKLERAEIVEWLRSPRMTTWVVMETADVGKRCVVLTFLSLLVDKLRGFATTLPGLGASSPEGQGGSDRG